MPRAVPYFYETTVFEPETGAEAGLLTIAAAVLQQVSPDNIGDPQALVAEVLGLSVGVPVPTPDDIPEVFFASLAGRVVPFDDFSFERWRAQRLEVAGDPRARFAVELAQRQFVAIEESPLSGATLAGLAARGTTWTVGGVQAFAGHPWTGLGVVILGEFGLVFASVARGFREEIYLATRYHLRRFFRVPPDWRP
jgi:hypothetical protein